MYESSWVKWGCKRLTSCTEACWKRGIRGLVLGMSMWICREETQKEEHKQVRTEQTSEKAQRETSLAIWGYAWEETHWILLPALVFYFLCTLTHAFRQNISGSRLSWLTRMRVWQTDRQIDGWWRSDWWRVACDVTLGGPSVLTSVTLGCRTKLSGLIRGISMWIWWFRKHTHTQKMWMPRTWRVMELREDKHTNTFPLWGEAFKSTIHEHYLFGRSE